MGRKRKHKIPGRRVKRTIIIDDPTEREIRQVHLCRDCRKPVFVERIMDTPEQEGEQYGRLHNARAIHRLTCEATSATAQLIGRQRLKPTRSLGEIVADWRG